MSTTFAPAPPDQIGLFTVQQVTQRSVNKRDGTSFTIYEIHTAENQEPFSTTKRPIAESAHELVGKVAELHYAVKQNGNFTNYYVNSILPPPLTATEAVQRAQEAQPLLRQAAGLPEPSQIVTSQPVYPTEKDRSIFRQTAAKVAATLATVNAPADPVVFWENVEKLAAYFETGEVLTTAVAQGFDGDDDIPF